MPSEEVDVVVIGMGPGGEYVAAQCATAGLTTVGIESRLVGGECPYFGCVPSKMIIRAADSLAEAGRVPQLAGSSTVTPDFTPVARRIRDEATDNWNDQVAVDRFTKTGGVFVRGRARITGPHTVAVGDREFTASRAS
ncbi:FAD-dependent oxidoreductase [Fodinicola feengrottensis]|uniref:FAD-dependent oxidoreductase n=1 Tax=Fodinicola feengrottensis TaxID=435914 RepID=UPI002442F6F8|nr:FAD-dependent oxidoreductase [Fodinicola feengrottensis]